VLYRDESLDWFRARELRSYDPARSEYEIVLKDAPAALSSERSRFDDRAAGLRGEITSLMPIRLAQLHTTSCRWSVRVAREVGSGHGPNTRARTTCRAC
jgi:hypothetical protein